MAIHLFNPMWDASGGSEWRTISLFELLTPHSEVSIWSEYRPDAALLGRVPIRDMPATRSFPRSGTFVFVGSYFEIGGWLKFAEPDRVILIYNVIDPPALDIRIPQLEAMGRTVELVFTSELMREHAGGRTGIVELSPIDLDRFSPSTRNALPIAVGRHSRDQPFKHHPDDPAVYDYLVQRNCRVRLLGASCIASRTGVERLPALAEPAESFLQSLDIFFYRTSPEWTEPYGRVVTEAMACGLPCVLGVHGGYADRIRPGENGFLFETNENAMEILGRLIEDPALRHRVGTAARQTVADLYEAEDRRILDFYLGCREERIETR